MAEIAYGESNNDPSQGPVVNLPTMGDQSLPTVTSPSPSPTKITITPPSPTKEWWSDDPVVATAAPSQKENAPKSQENSQWWAADPVVQPPAGAYSLSSTASDIGQTLEKNTIPSGIVGRLTYPADLFNLAYHYGATPLVKKVASAVMGRDLTPQEEKNFDQFQPLYGTQDIVQGGEKALGIEPYEPQTEGAKYLNTAGQMVLNRKPIGIAQGMTIPQAIRAGLGSQYASEKFPDSPIAPIVGALATEGAYQGVKSAARPVANSAAQMGIGAKENYGGVEATPQQAQEAQQKITESAQNPEAVQNLFQEAPRPNPDIAGPMPQNINAAQPLPGYKPTMAEVTQDPGVRQWQDALRSQNRAPFLERTAENNQALNQVINEQGGQGDSENVGQYFRSQLEKLENESQKATSGATADVQAATGEMGGLEKPAVYSTAAREYLEGGKAQSKSDLNKEWEPLRRYDEAPASGFNTQQAVDNIKAANNPEAGDQFLPDEHNLYQAVNNWKENPTFGTLRALRSNIGAAQRAARMQYGDESMPMRRLGMLKSGVDSDIEDTVNGITHTESQAVAAGEMSPTDTFQHHLLQGQAEWYANKAARETTAGNAGGGTGGNVSGRTSSVHSISGTKSEGTRGSANAKGNENISPKSSSAISDNFHKWFGDSKVVDGKGNPLTVYHGTGADISDFDFKFLNKGNDQLGSGFYFTTDPEEASAYTEKTLPSGEPKLGGSENPNVIPAYLSIKKPLDAHEIGNITASQVRKIIESSPIKEEGLSNWGENPSSALREAIPSYVIKDGNVLKGLNMLANDFYGDHIKEFNTAVRDVLGYDGVKEDYEGKTHYAAFFPDQIKQKIPLGDINKPTKFPPTRFDEEAQKQYAKARSATVEHKKTFTQGAVGQALAPGRQGAEYRLPDASVAKKFFHSGATAPDDINAYTKAVGGNEEAINQLRNYAVADLRDTQTGGINSDGTINPQKFDRWVAKNSKALEAFPELKKQLGTARAAQQTLIDTTADHVAKIQEYNKSRASLFLKNDPLRAVQTAFNSGNSAKNFAELFKMMKGDQPAIDGLKRATADYILEKVRGARSEDTSNIDLSTSKKYRQFVSDNNEALKMVFGGQGMNNLERVASHMYDADLAMKGAKIPGQSNTAQDTMNALKHAKLSIFSKMLVGAAKTLPYAGYAIGEHLGGHGLIGFATGEAAKLIPAMKASGIDTVQKLQEAVALNPHLMGELSKRTASEKMPVPLQHRIAASLLRTVPPVSTEKNEKKHGSEK